MACDRSVVSPGIMVSSTNKTDRNDITDIVVKVAVNTINQTKPNLSFRSFMTYFVVPEKIIIFMQFGLVGFHLEKITKILSYFLIRINKYFMIAFDDFWCFNATFNNISAISWPPVLMVEEAGVPSEKCEADVAATLHFNGRRRGTTDHGQASGKFYHLRLRVECTLFVIYKAGRELTPYW